MGLAKMLGLVLVTLFLPPVGVALLTGCGMDLLINILLTILGYFPGHIHAYYIEYQYYKRRDDARAGIYNPKPIPGVFSPRIAGGGRHVPQPSQANIPPTTQMYAAQQGPPQGLPQGPPQGQPQYERV